MAGVLVGRRQSLVIPRRDAARWLPPDLFGDTLELPVDRLTAV
jgi:hypothetical protein